MKKNFRQVRPEDFDVEALLAAAREGRLYVDEKEVEVSREQLVNEVRAYVERIKAFVTCRFRSSVDEMWKEILLCDEFVEFLTPGKKVRKCKGFDKYNVMRIIGVLREKGVYEQYSDRQFDHLLEDPAHDSPYRRYMGMGIDQRQLLIKIRQIVAKYQV